MKIPFLLSPQPDTCRGVFQRQLHLPTLEEDMGGFLGLSERQIKAVLYVKEKGKITNSEYQEINDIGKSVTIDELHYLVEQRLFVRIGETGRGTYYELTNGNDRKVLAVFIKL